MLKVYLFIFNKAFSWNPPGEFYLPPSCIFPTNRQNEGKFSTSSGCNNANSSLKKSQTTNPTKPNTLKNLSTSEKAGWNEPLWKEKNTYGSRWKTLCTWPPLCCAPSPQLSLPSEQWPSSPLFVGGCFGQITAGVHCCFWEPSPDVHGRPAAELAVRSLSLVGWPSDHHHPACPPACSSHPGLPQGTWAYNSASGCSEGSSDGLCPDLYTAIVPVTESCDQGHNSLGLSYEALNNAFFKGGAMYSGCLAARRDNWTLAAVLGVPGGLRRSQGFPAQLCATATLLFRSIPKSQNHPSLVHWELYALRMHYHPSLWPCTVRPIRIITVCNENISEQALSLLTFLHEN